MINWLYLIENHPKSCPYKLIPLIIVYVHRSIQKCSFKSVDLRTQGLTPATTSATLEKRNVESRGPGPRVCNMPFIRLARCQLVGCYGRVRGLPPENLVFLGVFFGDPNTKLQGGVTRCLGLTCQKARALKRKLHLPTLVQGR